RLERAVRTGVTGDLGRQAEQVEVLSPHLQEDLALRIELEGFLERFLDLVFVFLFVLEIMIMIGSTFLAGVILEIVWGHGVQASQESRERMGVGALSISPVRSSSLQADLPARPRPRMPGASPAGETAMRTSRRRPGWSRAPGRC